MLQRFGLLAILALLLTLPFSLPAFWDVIRLRSGGEPGTFVYLLKPVENQTWYLLLCGFTIGFSWLALSLFSRASLNIRLRPVNICVLVLFACQLIAASQAASPSFTLKSLLLPLVFYLAAAFVLALRPDDTQIGKTCFLLVIVAAIVSLYAVAQNRGFEILPYSKTVAGTDEEISGKQLIASTFGHPNYMASFLAPLVFWSLYFILARPTGFVRFTAAICGLLIIAALVVGGTRGPWLAVMLAGVPYYFVLAISPAYRRPLLFTAGLAIIAALVLLLVPNPFIHVQFDLQKRLLGSKEVAARFYYWIMAIEMFKNHPLTGIGYGNFDILFWDYVDAFQRRPQSEFFRYVLQESIRGVRPGYVHNDHLQILTEAGAIGAAAWIALWATLLHQGQRAVRLVYRNQRQLLLAVTILASLVCMAVDGLTNFPLHVPVSGLLFWILVGLWTVLYERTCESTAGTSAPSTTA